MSKLRIRAELLAARFWALHPAELDGLGYSGTNARQRFCADEIMKLVGGVEARAKAANKRADATAIARKEVVEQNAFLMKRLRHLEQVLYERDNPK